MKDITFNKGDVIFRQGEMGETFYRIEAGSAEVIVNYQGENEKKLTELGTGRFFGELAVLETYPRSATVIALEDGTIVKEIAEKELNDYFTQEPDKIMELFRHIGGRVRSLTADYQEASAVLEKLSAEEKTEDEGLLGRIGKVLGKFFGQREQGISAETLREIENADFTAGYSKETVNYKAGTVIFREGEPGRCMYAIHWGQVGIYTDYGKPEQKLLGDLNAGQFFGEMGMIEDEPRSATAVAMTDTTLEIINAEDLAELFEQNPPKVDMILQNLSHRLRKLTISYQDVCAKIAEKQNA